MRAVSSARSIYRASQNNESAMRESMSVFSPQHPGIFAAATLRGIYDERPGLQRDPRQSAGHDNHLLTVIETVGTQVYVTPGHAPGGGMIRGDAREADRRLPDIIAWVGFEALAEILYPFRFRHRPH